MKTKCNGRHAQASRLGDRCFFCENCRSCELSKQLPDWDENAERNEMARRTNELYPCKIKVWLDESDRPTIEQRSTIEETIEDVCGIPYVAGLNDCEVGAQVHRGR